MQQNLTQIKELIESKSGNLISSAAIEHGVIILSALPENILVLISALKNDPEISFKQLIDVTCVDYPSRLKRFEVIYQMMSLKNNIRLTIKTPLADNEAALSLTPVFECANWLEREVYDMYGIKFKAHPDLRRILTDYGFEGHPQRKDFPLTGYVEVRYDGEKGRVVYEPVKLFQDFRNFDYLSPWEGTDYVLPGDEKAKA